MLGYMLTPTKLERKPKRAASPVLILPCPVFVLFCPVKHWPNPPRSMSAQPAPLLLAQITAVQQVFNPFSPFVPQLELYYQFQLSPWSEPIAFSVPRSTG